MLHNLQNISYCTDIVRFFFLHPAFGICQAPSGGHRPVQDECGKGPFIFKGRHCRHALVPPFLGRKGQHHQSAGR